MENVRCSIFRTKISKNRILIMCLFIQAASLAYAVRLANATRSLGIALRAFQRITLRDWQT